MKKKLFLSLMFVFMLALVACGSSSDEDTITPAPVETSAPVAPPATPYDLVVKVTDQDGNPIPWATGSIQTSGKDVSATADDAGQLAWNGLPDSGGSLTVSAQGYLPAQESLSLEQGANELSIALERDPYALDPAEACQPGQQIVFVEDFEDYQAQGMSDISDAKWSFIDVEERGTVLEFISTGESATTKSSTKFGNAVWFFDMKTDGLADFTIFFHQYNIDEGIDAGPYWYFIPSKTGEPFELNFERPRDRGVLATSEMPVFDAGDWHTLAIAYYGGDISLWVDGQMALNVQHDPPIEQGNFGFIVNQGTAANILFDNLIVCGLEQPYAP